MALAPPLHVARGRLTSQGERVEIDVSQVGSACKPRRERRLASFDGRLQSVQLTGGTNPVTFLKRNVLSYNTDGSFGATQTLGDATSTTHASTFGVDGRLSEYHLSRPSSTVWPAVSPAASSSDPTNLTQQTDLIHLVLGISGLCPGATQGRDRVGNPLCIADTSTSTWPTGAQAVSQSFSYGNDYRLASVTSKEHRPPKIAALARRRAPRDAAQAGRLPPGRNRGWGGGPRPSTPWHSITYHGKTCLCASRPRARSQSPKKFATGSGFSPTPRLPLTLSTARRGSARRVLASCLEETASSTTSAAFVHRTSYRLTRSWR